MDKFEGFYFNLPYQSENVNSTKIFEYEGSKIGLSNVITSIKNNFINSPNNKIDVDEVILEKMFHYIKNIEEKEKIFPHDAIIHGVRVRLMTNSKHIAEFFVDNFYNPREYTEQSLEFNINKQGNIVPFKANIYVINGMFEGVPLFCYNNFTNTIYVFNCSFYRVILDLIIDIVSKILLSDRGFIIENALVFNANKNSFVCLNFNDIENKHPEIQNNTFLTYFFKIILQPLYQLQTLDYAVFRIAFYSNKSSNLVFPIKAVMPDGNVKKGYDVIKFLIECNKDENIYIENLGATLTCLTLNDEKIEILLSNIDLKSGYEIFTYPLFKNYYIPTGIVLNYPLLAYQFLHSKLENIPDVTQEYITSNNNILEKIVKEELRNSKDASISKYFNSISEEDGKRYIARLMCFPSSYSIIDLTKLLGKPKVNTNPFNYQKVNSLIFINHINEITKVNSAIFLNSITDNDLAAINDVYKLIKFKKDFNTNKITLYKLNIYNQLELDNNIENELLIKHFNNNTIYSEIFKKVSLSNNGEVINQIDGNNWSEILKSF